MVRSIQTPVEVTSPSARTIDPRRYARSSHAEMAMKNIQPEPTTSIATGSRLAAGSVQAATTLRASIAGKNTRPTIPMRAKDRLSRMTVFMGNCGSTAPRRRRPVLLLGEHVGEELEGQEVL